MCNWIIVILIPGCVVATLFVLAAIICGHDEDHVKNHRAS